MASPQPNRESVTTINEDGSRNFLRPADVRGPFTFWRRITAWLLVVFFLSLPFIPVNGYPAVFLDTEAQRFHFFGLTFVAQDLWIAFFFLTGLGFSLFVITALFGRIWCGWTCPQTVFLEHVYRRVERWFEGNASAQKRLDKVPWNDADKLFRRGGKHAVFILISLVIAHFVLAYFVSIPGLWRMMTEAPTEHWSAFAFVFITTGLLYFNFAWFREQLCLIICPYGRFQSALIDDDTLVVGYDEKRGEPRGKLKSGAEGDCIDCNRCVAVCPTGIDIRQGLQLECIGCSACIDACDEVMEKVGRPKGLIRYDSLNGLDGKPRRFWRPRLLLYAVLLLLGTGAMAFSLQFMKPGNLEVMRMAGSTYFADETGVRNQFMITLINKRNEAASFTLQELDLPDGYRVAGFDGTVTVPAMDQIEAPLIVSASPQDYEGTFTLRIAFAGEPGDFSLEREIEFLGPHAELYREHLKRKAEEAAAAEPLALTNPLPDESTARRRPQG